MQFFTKKHFFMGIFALSSQLMFAAEVNVAAGSNLLADVKSQISQENLNIVLQRVVESTTEALKSIPQEESLWLEKYVLAVRAAGPVVQNFLAKAKKFALNNQVLSAEANGNLDNFLTHFNKINNLGSNLFGLIAKVPGVKNSGVVEPVIKTFPKLLKQITPAAEASLAEADFNSLVDSVLISQTAPEMAALKTILNDWATADDEWAELARPYVDSAVAGLLNIFGESAGTFKDVGNKINSEVGRLKQAPAAVAQSSNNLVTQSNNTGTNVRSSRTQATQQQTRTAGGTLGASSSVVNTQASIAPGAQASQAARQTSGARTRR